MELVWRENENRTEIRPITEWNKSKEKEQKKEYDLLVLFFILLNWNIFCCCLNATKVFHINGH